MTKILKLRKKKKELEREQRDAAAQRKTEVSKRSRRHGSLNRFYKTLWRPCEAVNAALVTRGT